MSPYLFHGIVRPERAQLSVRFALAFQYLTDKKGKAHVSIILNQLMAWIDSDDDWDIYTLKNVVKSIVQNRLAILGYLKGYAYELEIVRAINQSRGIDHVFGIDIPCITERNAAVDLEIEFSKVAAKISDAAGIFLDRCLNDLVSAMKHADDTGFYCYRAIESLRHHCAAVNRLAERDKARQWGQFRTASGCTEDDIRMIKLAADPLRHGGVMNVDDATRASLFLKTWDIVDGYLKNA